MSAGLPRIVVLVDTVAQRRVFDEAAWRVLRGVGMVRRNPHDRALLPEEVAEMLAGADAAVTGWLVPRLDAELLAGAPRLQIVAHAAASVRSVVSEALWARGVRVTSAAAAMAPEVARTTVTLMHASVKRLWHFAAWTREGHWPTSQSPVDSDELIGKTVGVIGAGHVGREVIALLPRYGVGRTLVSDPRLSAAEAAALGAEKVELDDLLSAADVVTCHASPISETGHILDARTLRLMKDGAILINTARGSLIDEAALIAELRTGRIFACLDVTDPEPPSPHSDLRRLPNVVLTPHLAGATVQTAERAASLAAQAVVDWRDSG